MVSKYARRSGGLIACVIMPVNKHNGLLLITAASGKQATGLLPHLKDWRRLRLQVNSKASRDRLQKQWPDAEVVIADLASQADCDRILEGVTACYLVTPGFHEHETEMGYHVIDAARVQGSDFKHLVFSSVLHSCVRKMINHDAKRYIEEYLVESGVPFTILQPTTLMENLPIAKLVGEAEPTHTMLWNPSTVFSFVTARDAGEAAANIFAEREKHLYASYELVSTPTPHSYNEAISIVSEELGKEVSIKQLPIEEGAKMFATMLSHGDIKEAAFANTQGPARMFMYYNDKGLIGNPNVLEMLLGRKPMDYREWVKASIEEAKGEGQEKTSI
ncbi:hypothetical protein LTR78_008548 [Recurvomyces mirabilis]|uniref:NmrA-like domain-containing protein n=1 Tax=Recurvomyces mirabilis TaxID=574656 RepID=A0AAE0WIY5_9PEZI|nr:hypothetical protein LTR78_008548 [Recurvomyces mirabilis]KAK5156299.1 hypothetical protein LTS14_005187 [Recurvomyces mirabilis]